MSYDESAEHEPTWGTSFDAHDPDKQKFVDPRDEGLYCDHGILIENCETCSEETEESDE